MASESETIADIRKESEAILRGELKKMFARPPDPLRVLQAFNGMFDRIEEAWNRELNTKLIAEKARSAAEGYESGKRDSVGNAAAMREALIQCELFLSMVERHAHPTLVPGDKCVACKGAEELRTLVNAALAAPARNCDLPNYLESFKNFCRGRNCQGCKYEGAVADCYADFLLDLAEEKKGGAE